MDSCVERGIGKPFLRLICGSLSLGLLTLIIGCGPKHRRTVEHSEVSGKVLFQGKPLSKGRVNFVTVIDAFASSGPIDKNGHYQLEAPEGDVQISVINEKIPAQYQQPQTSGLKYTVKPGAQTHDIELSDKPSPAPGQ